MAKCNHLYIYIHLFFNEYYKQVPSEKKKFIQDVRTQNRVDDLVSRITVAGGGGASNR